MRQGAGRIPRWTSRSAPPQPWTKTSTRFSTSSISGCASGAGRTARWPGAAGLPRSTVYTLAMTRNLARPPRPATLDGLAKGLDVPVSAVRAAAAESTGLHYYDEVPAERGARGRPGAGAPDRQHRRADARGPSPRGRPRRIAAKQGFARADGRLAPPRLPRGPGTGRARGAGARGGADGRGTSPARCPRAPLLHRPDRGHPELLGQLPVGPSGSTRRATRRIAFGSSPGGRST